MAGNISVANSQCFCCRGGAGRSHPRALFSSVSGRSFRVEGAWQEEREAGQKRALVTSLKPLRVHGSPSQQPRPPTLEECEVIIERLYSALSLQSEEVSSEHHHQPPPPGGGTLTLLVSFMVPWCPADGACEDVADGCQAQQEDTEPPPPC